MPLLFIIPKPIYPEIPHYLKPPSKVLRKHGLSKNEDLRRFQRKGKTILKRWLWLIFSLPALCIADYQHVFKNVNLVSMESERITRNVDLLVNKGIIHQIGKNLRVGDSVHVIDGQNLYLMPGLAEMHAHIPEDQTRQDRFIWLNLAMGITTVRNMLGHRSHLILRDEIARGKRIGPQIFTAGPPANASNVPTAEFAESLVKRQREDGYNLIKIHPGIEPEVFDHLAITAKTLGIEFSGHIPEKVSLSHALKVGIKSVEHIDGFWAEVATDQANTSQPGVFGLNYARYASNAKYTATLEKLKLSGAAVTPTYTLFYNILGGETPLYMRQRITNDYWFQDEVEHWMRITSDYRRSNPSLQIEANRQLNQQRRLILDIHKADIPILLGADAPQLFAVPGFATLEELNYLYRAGLSEFEALKTGTVNPAVYLGQEDKFGSLTVGKRADMILLADNPLKDLRVLKHNHGVMVAGVWLSRDFLDTKLDTLKQP